LSKHFSTTGKSKRWTLRVSEIRHRGPLPFNPALHASVETR